MPEEKAHGTISMMTYINYFKAGANFVILGVIFFVFVLTDVSFFKVKVKSAESNIIFLLGYYYCR